MRRLIRHALPVALTSLLAACATSPHQVPKGAGRTATVAPPPAVRDVNHGISPAAKPVAASNVWDQLRGSFEMADCDADPAVLSWARRYTQNPRNFESQMRQALPRLVYVQQVAAQHHVAGEFALLPWVESHYRPVTSGKGNPAGMWQIMPVTANALGMKVEKNYDGRLDVPTATDAIMSLLSRYHDDLGDWRMVDYAYNAGEFAVRKLINQHGEPPADPVIPKLPVKRVTREHLTKLLAISCVVREPDRFNVTLPELPAEQQLVSVSVDRSMPMEQAADHAGMATDDLKDLNANFRNGYFDKRKASYLLMPSDKADQFRDALVQARKSGDTDDVPPLLTSSMASDDTPAKGPASKKSAKGSSKSAAKSTAKSTGKARTHTVKSGDTLWTISRAYSVDVDQIKRLNHLSGQHLRLGQVLTLEASRGG